MNTTLLFYNRGRKPSQNYFNSVSSLHNFNFFYDNLRWKFSFHASLVNISILLLQIMITIIDRLICSLFRCLYFRFFSDAIKHKHKFLLHQIVHINLSLISHFYLGYLANSLFFTIRICVWHLPQKASLPACLLAYHHFRLNTFQTLT